ncbi:hypothetical protein N7509_013944 [Penicillium cosmopolitanum]|uniref:Uncharacterized protein n=1 Tax=Penicillium cosmopolitanum TaxID=1131564 RepID=A0A9W9SEC7_9EURO|nr:uncharacterized protein N7509_013944 [Penicillium cosmopolitanum]KAJ5377058.1 hypothetical protein N7509_013944 [Penicillium cosmopolitanum]
MAFKILDSRCQDPEYVFGSMNILYTCAEAGELLTGNLTDTVYQCLCDYCEKSDPDLLGCPYQAIITLFGFDVDLDPYPYFSDNSRYSDSINKQENTDIGSPGISENNGLLTIDYNGIEKNGLQSDRMADRAENRTKIVSSRPDVVSVIQKKILYYLPGLDGIVQGINL